MKAIASGYMCVAMFMAMSESGYAQSDVTLYGLIDDAISFGHNSAPGGNVVAMTAGNLGGSRWGLKATKISAAA